MRYRKLISLAAFIVILATVFFTMNVFAFAAEPSAKEKAESTISEVLRGIGVEDGTVNGFYWYALGIIGDGMATMDEAFTDATGMEHNMAGLFQNAFDSTMKDFAGIETDEDALDRLEDIYDDLR